MQVGLALPCGRHVAPSRAPSRHGFEQVLDGVHHGVAESSPSIKPQPEKVAPIHFFQSIHKSRNKVIISRCERSTQLQEKVLNRDVILVQTGFFIPIVFEIAQTACGIFLFRGEVTPIL